MYAGRVTCCPLVSHGEYADGTDGWTDAEPLHYAFHYGRGQHEKCRTKNDGNWRTEIHRQMLLNGGGSGGEFDWNWSNSGIKQ